MYVSAQLSPGQLCRVVTTARITAYRILVLVLIVWVLADRL